MKNITYFGAVAALLGCALMFACCTTGSLPGDLVGPSVLMGCLGAFTVWMAELGGSKSNVARVAAGVSLYTMAHCSWVGNWEANVMAIAGFCTLFAAARPLGSAFRR